MENMKKVLWLIVCLMTMVVSFTSCYKMHEIKKSAFDNGVESILTQHKNWTDNSLAETQFTNEMISFFRGATNKNFSSFYDKSVSFDEIIPERSNYKDTDSVLVRFTSNRWVTTNGDGDKSASVHVNFAVTGIMSKIDASKLDKDYDYYIDGRVFGFIAYPITNTSTIMGNPSIDMGIICIDVIKIVDKKYINYKQI